MTGDGEHGVIVVELADVVMSSSLAVEQAFALIRQNPLAVFQLLAWRLRGRRAFRARVDKTSTVDPVSIPYRAAHVDWLRERRNAGARIHLVTGDAPRAAAMIAKYLGIFDEMVATYSDNPAAGPQTNTRASTILQDEQHPKPNAYLRTLARSLRLHQWAKNLLLFVPLLASHSFADPALVRDTLIAFVIFGLCASSVYLLNDLLDLPDDRRHPTKCARPLASGEMSASHALVLVPILLFGGVLLAAWLLPLAFLAALGVYYALTLAYSLTLKRIVMLDVLTLAMLYTVRVIAGAVASAQVATFWLLAFCVFIFLSLAFLKRYTELRLSSGTNAPEESFGRGYVAADFELLASLGGSAGYISVLVLALYINDSTSAALYHSQRWMWIACLLLLFWLSRVWLLAHRGQMPDDPIVFALRDRASRWIGLAFVAVFVLAAI